MYIVNDYDSFAEDILLCEFLRKKQLKSQNRKYQHYIVCKIVINLETSKMKGDCSFEHKKQMLKLMDQKIQ